MGLVDVIPGISAGTIALVIGIYQDFIQSLSSFVQKKTLDLLIRFKLKELFQHLNGGFLFPLALGIFTSIFLFAHIISFIYVHYPIPLWAFFSGLVLAATIFLLKEIKGWNTKTILLLALGIFIAWLATSDVIPLKMEDNLLSIFIAGLIAISAMMLPGISGSFLLILMGKYYIILEATKNLDWPIIITFGLGCVISLALFSKVINWAIKSYWSIALTILVGFIIGSLHKLWPWRETITTYLSSSGEEKPLIQKNLSPWAYQAIYNADPQLLAAIILAFIGVGIVFFLEKIKKNSLK